MKSLVIRRNATMFLASAAALIATPALAERIFYIDFENGNDTANGLSPATAWKRAPGDSKAEGKAKSTKLQAGDTLRFRGGVRYRGNIKTNAKGTEDEPIIFDGSSWGSTKAVIDGSDPLPMATRCRSAAECLNAPNWRQLMRVAVPVNASWDRWLFSSDKAMQLAQWPSVGPWEYDDTDLYASIPKADYNQLKAGFIPVSIPVNLQTGSPVLALWHYTNEIAHSTNFQIRSNGINFSHRYYAPYTNKDNKFAIMNTPMAIDAPGKYAISSKDGIAVFYPDGAAARPISIASHRPGIELSNAQNIVIRGFSFTNFASRSQEISRDMIAGTPILSTTSNTANVTITDNHINSFVLMTQQAGIRLAKATGVIIKRNSLTWGPYSTAIYVSDSKGPATIACNHISYVGRNGLRLLNMFQAELLGNKVEHLHGIHGAGVNLYLDNRLITMKGNIILDTHYPMTAKGNGGKPFFADTTPPNMIISDNILHGTDPRRAAFSSWGTNLHGLTFENNVLIHDKYAARLAGSEYDITFANNQLVGGFTGTNGLTLSNNTTHDPKGNGISIAANAATRSVSPEYCQ